MFTSKILLELDLGNEYLDIIELPNNFRIIPHFYETTGYIPSYTVEGEDYGGYMDYDCGYTWEDELDEIYKYIKEKYNVNEEDIYNIHYKIEDNKEEFKILMPNFKDIDDFRFKISLLIDSTGLSDESIDLIIHNKDFLDKCLTGNPYSRLYKATKQWELKNVIDYIDLTNTKDKCFLIIKDNVEDLYFYIKDENKTAQQLIDRYKDWPDFLSSLIEDYTNEELIDMNMEALIPYRK